MSSTARELVLASRNPKKLAEMRAVLEPLGFVLRPVTDFGGEAPGEPAPSFVENALIKARHAAALSGRAAIADDSGICVDALDGEPGVRSARYAGEAASDADNNARLLQALAGVPPDRRGAHYVCVLALVRAPEDPLPRLAEGLWHGRILDAPQGSGGFGYDPLFFVPAHGRTAAELPAPLKNRISHRARAAAALLARLREG